MKLLKRIMRFFITVPFPYLELEDYFDHLHIHKHISNPLYFLCFVYLSAFENTEIGHEIKSKHIFSFKNSRICFYLPHMKEIVTFNVEIMLKLFLKI
jgi:hypothetical protein